jgi:hypothetical protein
VTIFSRVADPPAAEAHRLYVAQLYRDLLQREPDTGGLAYWGGLLDGGTASTQVVQGILNSREYRQLQVRQLYVTYLQRPADARGLASFTGLLKHGGTLEQVQARIVGSTEYWQRRAGGTAAGFLDALYQDALGRAIDPSGRASWSQALRRGMSREDVAAALFASEEYRADLVQGVYQGFLGRVADPGGLATFTDALRHGARTQEVLGAVLASPEYPNGVELAAS